MEDDPYPYRDSRFDNASPNAVLATDHFEAVASSGNNNVYIIFEKGRRLKGIPVTVSDSIQILDKLERLYPCHFLAKEWQQPNVALLFNSEHTVKELKPK